MALTSVIFDNTVFNYFLRISSVDLESIVRKLLFERVLIPSQIIIEMERLAINEPAFRTKIYQWIDRAHRNSFYHYCDTYDSIVFETVKKVLDTGEAGAIAQAQKTNVCCFISDDKKNIPFIKQNFGHIRQYSIFYLIALADVSGFLPNYNKVLSDILFIRNYPAFTDKSKKELKSIVRKEYKEALLQKGLKYSKKLISKKTSFDTILKDNNLI